MNLNYEYDGTKITIEPGILILTGMQILLSGLFLLYWEPFPAITLLLLAGLPFLHEAGHYLIAREHGFKVSSVSLGADQCKTGVDGNLSHRDMMDISFAGELATGTVFILATLSVFAWGYMNNSPFTVVSFAIPLIWVATWISPESDFRIGWTALQYHMAQQGKE